MTLAQYIWLRAPEGLFLFSERTYQGEELIVNYLHTCLSTCLVSIVALLSTASYQPASAQTAPSLGGASSFAVLGGTAVTCTDSVVTGDVGVSPGSAITQTSCTISGTVHAADAAADLAQVGFVNAYAELALVPCTQTLSGELGAQTLTRGVYCFDAAATSTGGTLTLDAQGDPNAVWIFKIAAALTTTNFSVVMVNGGQPCNVYWRVGAAATTTDSAFVGTILAGADMTFTRGSLAGRALGQGAVTLTGIQPFGGCAAEGPSACKRFGDWVTGGGWIKGPHGGKANFGVAGGIKKNAFWGHLTYQDHGRNGPKVKGTGVTAYVAIDAVTRHIEGTAEINGFAGTYEVDVADKGERGRSDTFSLTLSTGYHAEGSLAGGNIQLHKPHKQQCEDGRDHHGKDGDDRDDDDRDEGDREPLNMVFPFGGKK